MTETSEQFGSDPKKKVDDIVKKDLANENMMPAGYLSIDKKRNGLQTNSVLIGELYKN